MIPLVRNKKLEAEIDYIKLTTQNTFGQNKICSKNLLILGQYTVFSVHNYPNKQFSVEGNGVVNSLTLKQWR
jgi:hypothetical protein